MNSLARILVVLFTFFCLLESAAAITITSGQTLTGIIGLGQSNTVTMNLSSNTTYFLSMAMTSGNLSPAYIIYDPSGNVFTNKGGGSNFARNYQRVTQTGTYTVVVFDYYGYQTGNYNLQLSIIPGMVDSGGLISGQTVSGTIGLGQFHAYAMNLNANDNYILAMTNTSGTLAPSMIIYDPSGNVFTNKGNGANTTRDLETVPLGGIYTAVVFDYYGYQTGNYTLSLSGNITTYSLLQILRQPESLTLSSGATAQFMVAAIGIAPLKYQWFKNLIPISGATNATLTLTNIQITDAGSYFVSVYNQYPFVLSSTVQLAIKSPLQVFVQSQPLTGKEAFSSKTAVPPPNSTQLKFFEGGVFKTNPTTPPNSSRMSVVLTHGWSSNPDIWATGMASSIVSKITPTPNIFAWDWKEAADTLTPFSAGCLTRKQGAALGEALSYKLGFSYVQPIHFIGHSLGTIVNASAINYLNGDASHPWPTNAPVHVTLLDEAELATIQLGALGFYLDPPLPNHFIWADSYISLCGLLHKDTNLLNVFLKNGSIFNFHSYPCVWYNDSITNPVGATALAGFRWSYEKGSLSGAPTNVVYVQTNTAFGLVACDYPTADGWLKVRQNNYMEPLGQATVRPSGNLVWANNNNVNASAWTIDAGVSWLSSIKLGTSTSGFLTSQVKGALTPKVGSNTNPPVYVWIPLAVPVGATSLSFDFMVEGDWQNDSLAAAWAGTNVLLLSGNQLTTNFWSNSGLIDVSAYAGQTNQLFVAITGGTSVNANLTVQNLVFSSPTPPNLQIQVSGTNTIVSWPLTVTNYLVQATTNLSSSNSWHTLNIAPAAVEFKNTVTNPLFGPRGFYRLIRSP